MNGFFFNCRRPYLTAGRPFSILRGYRWIVNKVSKRHMGRTGDQLASYRTQVIQTQHKSYTSPQCKMQYQYNMALQQAKLIVATLVALAVVLAAVVWLRKKPASPPPTPPPPPLGANALQYLVYAFAWTTTGDLQIVLTPGAKTTPTFIPAGYVGGQAVFATTGDTTATEKGTSVTVPGIQWSGQNTITNVSTAATGPLSYWTQNSTIVLSGSSIPSGYSANTAYIISNGSVTVMLYQPVA